MSILRLRNRHETQTTNHESGQRQVLPTEGRPLPFVYEDAEVDPARRSRAAMAYQETDESGEQYDVVELVMGETVTSKRGEQRTMKTIAEDEMDTMRGWAKQQLGRGSWTLLDTLVTYLVEYPREEAEDFIDGLVLSMDSSGRVRQYQIHEEDEQAVVESEQELEEVLEFPKGTRITRTVRGRLPTDGSSQLPEVNKMPRNEDTKKKEQYILGFMREVRDAVDTYKDDARHRTQAMGETALNG